MNEEETITRIVDELTHEEQKRLFYLCADLDAGTCGENLTEKLECLVRRGQMGPVFLLELMYKMRRFDILKKVLGSNRKEVEGLLGNGSVVSDYRTLMADVSEDLGKDDLRAFIFLLSGVLPRGRQEAATSFLDVIIELEKMDKVSSENVELIVQCLRKIRRADLAKKVHCYQERVPESQICAAVQSQSEEPIQMKANGIMVQRAPQPPRTACLQLLRSKAQKNVKMSVPETGRQYCQDPLEVYRMQARPRGVCVIVDCVGNDGDMLEETFKRLHFTVTQCKWPSVRDTWSFLEETAERRREHQEADAFICCILSRSNGTNLLATEEQGPGLALDSVRRLFATDVCPSLGGKPKLFFIQSYNVSTLPPRWHRDEDLETDGPAVAMPTKSVPVDADVLWSECCTEARNLEIGSHQSVYVRALSAALLKGQERRIDVLDIHTEINSVVYEHNQNHSSKPYSLSLRHTLRKALFFT